MDAAEEETHPEDAERVKNARRLLEKFQKRSMAEIITARLHIGEKDRTPSSEYAYKNRPGETPASFGISRLI